MPGRIIDLSSNNPHPINWAQVKDAGVTTVIVKATEGTGYVNPYYATDMADAQGVGLDVMGYHFAAMTSAVVEAEHFKLVAGAYAQCLDFETNTNWAWAKTFLAELDLPAGRCITYGSASSLQQGYQQLPSLSWVAAYQSTYPGWGTMWQFASSATVAGISGQVDESRWYGTQDQYDELFGHVIIPPTPQENDMLIVATPTGKGYLKVAPNGAVNAYGDAPYLGGANTSNTAPGDQPPKWTGPPVLQAGDTITGAAWCAQGGYWLESAKGFTYAYGAAQYFG